MLLANGRTMLEQLDPVTRARVLAALLGLIVLGMGLMLLAWLFARFVRRYGKRTFAPPRAREESASIEDVWWKKPVITDSDGDLPDDEGS